MRVSGLSLMLGPTAAILLPAALCPSINKASAAEARNSVGATVPWVTCEAESAQTSGTVLGPAYSGQSAEREASGRRCVRLSDVGHYVEFKASTDAQGLVVRYSVPDTTDGRGTDYTLGLLINGKPAARLSLTSKLSHLYGEYPFNNDPKTGNHRNFWDEVRLMPGTIHRGDTVRLQKDADDSAAEYLIDFIDLEAVPAPLDRPAGSLSIVDFGATANDATDDTAALRATVEAGQAQGKTVWIPKGEFIVKGAIEVRDVTIRGAGMWHSTLVGVDDYSPQNRIAFYGVGSNINVSDFAIFGKLNYRNDSEPNDGLGEAWGTGSSIRNMWIEHTKAGAWIVNSDGLIIEDCRFRNTIADGANLCIGMRNSVVRNCTARGTGDDCFAMWPATYKPSAFTHGANRYVNCTAQLPFLAQAFAIYGGEDNLVEGCEARDIPYGAGLFASTTFPSEFGFRGITTFRRNAVTRAGGNDGAVGVFANLLELAGVRFEETEVVDTATDAIKFTSVKGRTIRDVSFDQLRISRVGLGGTGYAFFAGADVVGTATASNITVSDVGSVVVRIASKSFELVRGTGWSGSEGVEGTKSDRVEADQRKMR